ncbi:hypothetical protein DFH27DRAFT_122373 [Peziza echinospora]|nr:hypothetical protein DFH27DRAFT_122373 [Peziza echinospora]
MSPLANPEVLHSDGWSDDDQLVEEDLQNPFFDREDPAVQHLVNSQWVATTWMEDSEDEDDAWKYCLSSDDSSEGEGDDESTQGVECGNNGDDSAEDEDSDSDATDDDEDLPLPTPLTLSKLKRLSSPTPESSQPQILQRDPENRNGPFLGSWVADPTRPICIIDGAKKTMLVPSNHKRFSIDSESSYHNIYSLLEETEFDSAVIFAQATPIFTYGVSNPTMAGFSVGAGGYLNGADMCGPPEAFNPRRDFSDFDELLREEYNDGNEDSVDEEEQMLSFEDILALSESEDEVDGSKQENQVAQTQESDAEVNRWQYIPVTSFRKRQQQHKQRLSGQLSYWNKGRSVMKPKLTSTDATMAPARRRKAAIIKTPYIKPAGLPKKRV